ncbi:MAG TPA: AAA family ATPase [Burkholderiaceae bacterium]|nr:AAA family ATPase [Burkholderiaceae bacterium]
MDAPASSDSAAAARCLGAGELAARCDPATLQGALDGAGTLPRTLVGQRRALQAAAFAFAMPHEGYHLFVSGPPGSGKKTLAHEAIAEHVARQAVQRSDWVYVNNFDQPYRPLALELPGGRGAVLRNDLRALVLELRSTIPAMFDSEEFVAEVERINAEYKERAEQALEAVAQDAQRRGLAMLRTPMGFTFAPTKDGEVMPQAAFEALPLEQREALQRSVAEVQEQLVKVLRTTMRSHKEHADRVRAASRATTSIVVEHAIGELLARYADLPAVHRYLKAVRDDVIEHADDFRPRSAEGLSESALLAGGTDDLGRYEVNLLVDASGSDGGAVLDADWPSHANLVGRVEHLSRFGALVTDFRMIKPGLLHRANGGHLLIDAVKLLTQPYAWEALKRALTRREIRIESLGDVIGLVSTVQLEPEPIPLKVKVVLFGDRQICALLQAFDPEFGRLFRVQADLGDELPREPGTQLELARVLAARMQAGKLLPPTTEALAALIDHGTRCAGDTAHIDSNVQRLFDVAFEAEHLARSAARDRVLASDIAAAVAARRDRAARVHERMHEAMLREQVLIATQGSRVGQVNGLSVYAVGDEWFGAPMRITATSRFGDGRVIDVQRESSLSGPLQAKGVMILSSFIAARYSRLREHSISASLVFEQTYGIVDGDSASLGELVALLSSIGDTPIKQSLAVTGSVNQFGDVQPIGGVNEKIEGFFELCRARGLDGQGIVLPAANVSSLMLGDAVIDAVREGRFAIYAVSNVDAALEVMTGLAAGDPNRPDSTTANGRVVRRLSEFAGRHLPGIKALRRVRMPPRQRPREGQP